MKKAKVLHLNLKGKYFEKIADKSKKFEYRLYNEYWRKRLQNPDGSPRKYNGIILKHGYPRSTDLSKHLKRVWRGFEIQDIKHPEFGGEKLTVFAIRVN